MVTGSPHRYSGAAYSGVAGRIPSPASVADGSNPTRVTNSPVLDFASSWTSDRERLIIDTDRDGNWDIYSINVDGTDPVRLTTPPAADEFPAGRP